MRGRDSSLRPGVSKNLLFALALGAVLVGPSAALGQAPDQTGGGRPEAQEAQANGKKGRKPRAPAQAPARTPEQAADEPDEHVPTPAELFEAKLKEALLLEVTVFEYELASLGKKDPATLEGHRLRRRLRIEADKALFAPGGRTFSLAPLRFAEADSDRPAAELAILTAVRNAYEASRAIRPIELMIKANREFLATTEWLRRDSAVRYRNEIFARETAFTRLAGQASDVARGKSTPALLQKMRETLQEVAPDALATGGDLTVMVLSNPTLRHEALEKVQEVLSASRRLDPLPPSEEELLAMLLPFHKHVLNEIGITEIEEQFHAAQAQALQLDTELEEAADALISAQIQARRRDVRTRINQLRAQYYSTPMPEELARKLLGGYDMLIQRRMIDLGPRGAFFATRHDAVRAAEELRRTGGTTVWRVLDKQAELLAELDAARPDADLLAGLPPLPRSEEVAAFNLLNAQIQAQRRSERAREAKHAKAGGRRRDRQR